MTFDAKSFIKTLTSKAGVYRMYGSEGCLLYVGKAKNLKNRVSSYFNNQGLNAKTQALVIGIASIEISITGSETEALLLEQNVIKKNRPPYNILLKDDKSYPYIHLSEHKFPLLSYARANKKKKGHYFGPFPNAGAVKESLSFLQKLFRLRNCEDSVFNNRSRPCLQYQIGRCSAPCVNFISAAEYNQDIQHANMFLSGKSRALLSDLQTQMDEAAQALAFEEAGRLRDQIQYLRKVQESQAIDGQHGDLDVLAITQEHGISAIHVANIRGGRMLGSRSFYPKFNMGELADEALAAFISQFYLTMSHEIPDELVVSHALPDMPLIQSAFSQHNGRAFKLSYAVRGDRLGWLQMVQRNADEAVRLRREDKQHRSVQYNTLKEALGLETVPLRMECFDVSHSHGEATVASCVVFNQDGPLKTDYRKYNIEGVEAGDDYAAMGQALERRFKKMTAGKAAGNKVPQLLLIDGGKGQVGVAKAVLEKLDLQYIPILGVSKGPARKAGMEILIFNGREFSLDIASPALHLIQQIRDESHRFAITGHRARRAKARGRSILEDIEGIGPKRRKELIRFFGDAGQVKSASIDEIAKVPSISRHLAQEIYNALHD